MTSLWVPGATLDDRPGYLCRVCGTAFAGGQQAVFEKHVVRCGEEHHDALVAKNDGMRRFNEPLDPEWAAYNQAMQNAGIDPDEQYNRGRRSNIRRASES